MLATLDLGEFLGPLGQLSWACLCCGRLVTAAREAEEHMDSAAPTQLHPEDPGTGAPFTPQDNLTLRELLETEAWVQQVAERPGGCS